MIENYQVGNAVAPLGAVLALDLLTTVTQTAGTTNQGTVHVANSVACYGDFNGTFETQTIAAIPTEAIDYTLTVGAVVLTSGALGAAPTIATLVSALQADGDYAAAPFTVTANGSTGIKITWKAIGAIATVAALTDSASTVYTTVTTIEGGGGVSSTCTLLMPGERLFNLADSRVLSFQKVSGASDGIIRITYCN